MLSMLIFSVVFLENPTDHALEPRRSEVVNVIVLVDDSRSHRRGVTLRSSTKNYFRAQQVRRMAQYLEHLVDSNGREHQYRDIARAWRSARDVEFLRPLLTRFTGGAIVRSTAGDRMPAIPMCSHANP